MRKFLILLGALAVFVVGCGGDSTSTPVSLTGKTTNKGSATISGNAISVEQDDYYFSPTFIKAPTAGATVTVTLKNEGSQKHTFTSDALGVDKEVAPGATETVQVTLPQSGAVLFYCRFHQTTNGMQGAFYFKDGDVVGAGASPAAGASSQTSSSTSSSNADPYGYGGYN